MPEPFDAYLDGLEPAQRAALERLRKAVHAAVPGLEESVYYGMPAFKLGGKALVAIAAWKEHAALYPLSAAVLEALAPDLLGHSTRKGTVRFEAGKPIPVALVKKIVQARAAELQAKQAAKPAPRPPAQRRRRAQGEDS
jgi:uncharacterized protein YdhG (YjbR/CyaY superfamily)